MAAWSSSCSSIIRLLGGAVWCVDPRPASDRFFLINFLSGGDPNKIEANPPPQKPGNSPSTKKMQFYVRDNREIRDLRGESGTV